MGDILINLLFASAGAIAGLFVYALLNAASDRDDFDKDN